LPARYPIGMAPFASQRCEGGTVRTQAHAWKWILRPCNCRADRAGDRGGAVGSRLQNCRCTTMTRIPQQRRRSPRLSNGPKNGWAALAPGAQQPSGPGLDIGLSSKAKAGHADFALMPVQDRQPQLLKSPCSSILLVRLLHKSPETPGCAVTSACIAAPDSKAICHWGGTPWIFSWSCSRW